MCIFLDLGYFDVCIWKMNCTVIARFPCVREWVNEDECSYKGLDGGV